ncbi:MAG: flagellar biosynthesis protein FlhB [Treponema sp.]|nr:flagellar biosynthesis protein FlhB [Treponema sp.]
MSDELLRAKLLQADFLRTALEMDLQWFSDPQGGDPEDEGRTHEPTEVTFRKAREEGRVAKSQELVAALGLLLPAIAIFLLAPWILRTCAEMLRFFFTRINELDPLTDRIVAGIFINYFLRIALPILTVAVIAALFSNIVQVGFLFSTKPIELQFSRILPKFGRYFKKIFSSEGLFNLAKSILKLVVIGAVAYVLISSQFHELVNLQKADLWTAVTIIASLAGRLLIIVAILLLVLSIPDVFFQRWQFRRSLKMTRESAKEELKQDEGDPEVRARLRHRYRELLSRNMLNDVPRANVVITNPTHFSVAIEYNPDPNLKSAPRVIAKGEDELAFKIREVAKENGVPVVSHPPLTRALYYETRLGDEIPIKYWYVVVLVLRRFLSLEQKQAKGRVIDNVV